MVGARRMRNSTVRGTRRTRRVPLNAEVRFRRGPRLIERWPANQNIYVLRGPHGRFVDAGNPQRDGISTGHGIGHSGRLQRRRRFQKTLANSFHGIHHTLH